MLIKAQKHHTKLIEKGCWWRVLNEPEEGMSRILEHFCQVKKHDPDWDASGGNPARVWHVAFKSAPIHGVTTSYRCTNCESTAPAKVRAYIYLAEVQVPKNETAKAEDLLKQLQQLKVAQLQQIPFQQTPFQSPTDSSQWIYNPTTSMIQGPTSNTDIENTVQQKYEKLNQLRMLEQFKCKG